MINYLVLYGTPGTSQIIDPRIAYVKMLVVKRSGLEYDLIDGVPSDGARQCLYEPDSASVIFDGNNPFLGPPITDLPVSILDFESVYLMYEI